MAKILKATPEAIKDCKLALEHSQVIAVPTETVYGLAANALDVTAVEKIFAAKQRPFFDPLILHTNSIDKAQTFCDFNPLADQLAKYFWPGALTLILKKKAIVPNIVTANLDSVAVRCPKHPIFQRLLEELPFPLAAPSANPFGYISPTSAEHVEASLGNHIEIILDGSNSTIGIESTIVDARNPEKPKILRPGPITQEMLEDQIKLKFDANPTQKNTAEINELRGPGMLKSHYSPKTSLELSPQANLERLARGEIESGVALLFLKKPAFLQTLPESVQKDIFWLSEDGLDLHIAQNLYRQMRIIDAKAYKRILVETLPNENGLNSALIDRLTKAAHQ